MAVCRRLSEQFRTADIDYLVDTGPVAMVTKTDDHRSGGDDVLERRGFA